MDNKKKKKTTTLVKILLTLTFVIVIFFIIVRLFLPKTKIKCDYTDGPVIYGVETDSGNTIKAGTYTAHVDNAMTFKGETQAHAPGLYDIWIIDHDIDSTGELTGIDPDFSIGGMSNDYVDIALKKGDYIVIRPYEVGYYPLGYYVMTLRK